MRQLHKFSAPGIRLPGVAFVVVATTVLVACLGNVPAEPPILS